MGAAIVYKLLLSNANPYLRQEHHRFDVSQEAGVTVIMCDVQHIKRSWSSVDEIIDKFGKTLHNWQKFWQ